MGWNASRALTGGSERGRMAIAHRAAIPIAEPNTSVRTPTPISDRRTQRRSQGVGRPSPSRAGFVFRAVMRPTLYWPPRSRPAHESAGLNHSRRDTKMLRMVSSLLKDVEARRLIADASEGL